MGRAAGIALRGLQFFVRAVQFFCAAIVLAIFSYFLVTLHNHEMPIAVWLRAVEGMAGAGVLYTILAILILCCMPAHRFPSFIMMVLDVLFIGAFIYIAVANRAGASSCDGEVDTPFGKGDADTNVVGKGDGAFMVLPSLRQACKMQTACLAVSGIAAFFFVFSPFITLGLVRHRLKERRYGPSPANNYTSGYGGRRKGFGLFGRSRKHTAGTDMDDNSNALPHHATPDDMRNSYGTDHTHVGSGYGGLSGSKYGDDIPMDRYGNNAYRYEHGGAYR